jgi:hypothetical protein
VAVIFLVGKYFFFANLAAFTDSPSRIIQDKLNPHALEKTTKIFCGAREIFGSTRKYQGF